MIDARWEQGSEFHWHDPGSPGEDADRDWLLGLDAIAHASGRGALQALVEHGGWTRVWLPSYVCAELAAALGERVRFYADDPTRPSPPEPSRVGAEAGDAVVRINYFGLRGPASAARLRARGVVVIDDHTHDPCGPWAKSSDADYCLASLRKSLPLPDGALSWSPLGHALPPPAPASEAAAAKLPAMLLKALYLAGQPVSKAVFRELAVAGEARLGALGVAGMSAVSTQLLACLKVAELRRRRRENFASLAAALAGELELLAPAAPGLSPFAGVLRFSSAEARERVRRRLIAARIYPAVLWPLDELSEPGVSTSHRERFPAACELGDRLLALHCDGRYGPADMRRVAEVVLGA
jgi:hypothetical protein